MQNSIQMLILLLMVVLKGLTKHAHKKEKRFSNRSKVSIVNASF